MAGIRNFCSLLWLFLKWVKFRSSWMAFDVSLANNNWQRIVFLWRMSLRETRPRPSHGMVSWEGRYILPRTVHPEPHLSNSDRLRDPCFWDFLNWRVMPFLTAASHYVLELIGYPFISLNWLGSKPEGQCHVCIPRCSHRTWYVVGVRGVLVNGRKAGRKGS